MKTIAISDLRANLMQVLKQTQHGTKIEITSHGKVIARLVPPDTVQREAVQALNKLSESAAVYDVIAPLDEAWDAQSE